MASNVGPVPSYTISGGPLTALWTPPISCLSTVTSYSGSYFQGYIPAIGIDPACYPPLQTAVPTSVVVTSTTESEPNLSTHNVVARNLVNAVNLYSPGICPSGWAYALSCKHPFQKKQSNLMYVTDVTTAVAAAATSASFNDSFLTAPTSQYTYFCCPDGFQLDILTPGPSPTILIDYASCTSTDTILDAVWAMKSSDGWPKSKPSDIQVYTEELAYEPSGCSVFTVTASGIAVAWAATDTAAVDFLQDDIPDAKSMEWPPQWPISTPHPSCMGGSPTWLVPAILPSVFIGGALCLGCCCICWIVRKKKQNRGRLWTRTGTSWERLHGHGESMPLTDIQPAHLAEHTSYPHSEQSHDVESLDEERLPSYNETLAMGNENLDATNAGMLGEIMRASHIEGESREIITP